MIVVDTNVLVYLCTESPHRAAAEAWGARDPDWCVPALALTETANVLLGMVRRGTLDAEAALLACRILQRRLRLAAPVTAERVLATALASGLSAYNAEFVVVAREYGVRLVTHDAAVLRSCPDVAVAVTAAA